MLKPVFRPRIIFITILFSFIVLISFCIVFFFINFYPFIPLIRIAPDMLGMNGKRTYLIIFQNNAELRPGGGFIGSYALVSFDKGKLGQLTIHNIYDADGLLHKHIEPYFIGRRYIQVHLYMRDSNFDVDFVKSAQKVAYMLAQESGQKVDGVIGIDLSFVKSLLQVISPVYVWQYNQTITPSNFFLLTETYSDKHSFFGSTQKQDFLRNFFDAIQMKIETNKVPYYLQFMQKIADGLKQKHIVIAVSNPNLQKILTRNRLSSALYDPRQNTEKTINDFLGINEANIGVNKANYFLKRSINQYVVLDKEGLTKDTVNITYTNTTQSESWPSGTYKNYLRLILPLHTTLQTIAINNQQQKIIPAITDFRIYEAPGFHPPQGIEVDTAEESGKTIYGFIVSIGPKITKTVTITYQLPLAVKLPLVSSYDLYLFKQPGMDTDPYSFTLTTPKGYTVNQTQTMLLSTDKDIQIPIKKL